MHKIIAGLVVVLSFAYILAVPAVLFWCLWWLLTRG